MKGVSLLMFLGILWQPRWNQSWQTSHWAINIPAVYGCLQWQNTSYFSMRLLIRCWRAWDSCGKSSGCPSLKHIAKWLCINPWSNSQSWGKIPKHKQVATAIANSPQSLPPICLCTSAHWTVTCFEMGISMYATCLWNLALYDGGTSLYNELYNIVFSWS